KLYCADDPSAKPICFSGSGAASGAITCKDGTSLSTWGCKNGVAETGENTQCGAGGDANYYCISGTDATYKYSEDGCASGTGNPGCGLGANHLS
ncbi:MAG: hypothetical protein GY756_26305, partial [bacterium]|nr:hypothetical protein [bacterium]